MPARSSALILIVGSVLFFSSPVRADFYAEGPIPANSVVYDTFAFNFSTTPFDLVAVVALDGTLEANALTDFEGVDTSGFLPARDGIVAASWSELAGSTGTFAAAMGTATSNLVFGVNFTGMSGVFDVAVFGTDGSVLGAARIVDGTVVFLDQWTGPTRTEILGGGVAAPAPRASLLAIIGLGFVGLVSRRFN